MLSKLKQFKNLRDRAKDIQQLLSKEIVEGCSGWGKVKVVINGNQQIQTVAIDPSLLQDKKKLEELVRDATNDAIQKIQKVMANKLKESGGMDLASEFGEMMKS